jgi:hypothetical protein
VEKLLHVVTATIVTNMNASMMVAPTRLREVHVFAIHIAQNAEVWFACRRKAGSRTELYAAKIRKVVAGRNAGSWTERHAAKIRQAIPAFIATSMNSKRVVAPKLNREIHVFAIHITQMP